jgi:hypothetical protein
MQDKDLLLLPEERKEKQAGLKSPTSTLKNVFGSKMPYYLMV